MPKRLRHRYPIGGQPVALISWYAPDGRSVALATSWAALVNSEVPRLRAAWPGRRDPRSLFWPGGDFVLNVPAPNEVRLLCALVDTGRVCFDVDQDLTMSVEPATAVNAPRLWPCPVQLECCGGHVDDGLFEPEISGQLARLYHGGHVIDDLSGFGLEGIFPFRSDAGEGAV